MKRPLCRMTRGVFLLARKIRRRTFRKKHRRKLRLLLCLTLLVLAVRGFEHQAGVFGKNYFPTFARQVTTKCVCRAVEQALREGEYTYDDFASLQYHEGQVSAIKTNAAAVNQIKNRVTSLAEQEIEQIHNSVVSIPLGAFTGLTLIANSGPKIPLTYCLTGSFSAELVSTFESAGINQTIHHIKLVVTSKIVTASVDYDGILTFSTDYEIAQSVIVGAIPTTYGGYYTRIP